MTIESLPQLSGAVAGGLVGGLAGFAANMLRLRVERQTHRRNVASALAAEIESLCQHISGQYLNRLRPTQSRGLSAGHYPYHGFRSEREYMPVYRVLGQNLGYLPPPTPRQLIFWYTGFTLCLERARDIYEAAQHPSAQSLQYANEMAALQRQGLERLLAEAPPLVKKLQRLSQQKWFQWRVTPRDPSPDAAESHPLE
jgi:hypothetical protein